MDPWEWIGPTASPVEKWWGTYAILTTLFCLWNVHHVYRDKMFVEFVTHDERDHQWIEELFESMVARCVIGFSLVIIFYGAAITAPSAAPEGQISTGAKCLFAAIVLTGTTLNVASYRSARRRGDRIQRLNVAPELREKVIAFQDKKQAKEAVK
jgi:hypothetical protein